MDRCEEESLLCRFRLGFGVEVLRDKDAAPFLDLFRMTPGIVKHLSCLVVLRLKPRCGAVDFVSNPKHLIRFSQNDRRSRELLVSDLRMVR